MPATGVDGAASLPSLDDLLAGGRLDLPHPGSGATMARFAALADLAAVDLSVARLAEGHTDAVAILAEADVAGPTAGGRTWGVWAADPPDALVQGRALPSGAWVLSGTKRYCSGAGGLDAALVTAVAEDGPRLFAVDLHQPGIEVVTGSWAAVGMAATRSLSVRLDDVAGEPVGPPGWYTSRPGFWHGAVGVAACWYGGAEGVAGVLRRRAGRLDGHGLAHLGAVEATTTGMRLALEWAAHEIDADPGDATGGGRRRALVVRAIVERGCTEVLERVGRATGSGPAVFDAEHARRVADLPVYLRQSHAEADLAELGRLVDDGS